MVAEPQVDRAGRLLELAVDDLALIDRLRLAFSPGLNVLTGETGAGKSLLIDALGLALGARADATLVRHGAESARVEALFDRLPEPLIAVREVGANGRSTARVDDDAVTAGRLALATGGLVEIHGQHDQQRLLDEGWQRDLLDAYGGHGELRAVVARGRRALAREPGGAWPSSRWTRASCSAASTCSSTRRPRSPPPGLRPGEAAEITGQLATAQHGETITAGAIEVRETLLGEGRGAREQVARAEQELRSLARLDGRWARAGRPAGRARGGGRGRRRPRREPSPRPWTTTRRRSRGSRSGWARSTACCGATATTRRRSSSTASGRRPRRSGCAASRTSAPAGRPTTRGCCSRSPTRPRRLSIRRAETASGLAASVGGGARRARVSRRRVRRRARATPGRARRSGGRGGRRRRRVRRHRDRHRRVHVPAQRGRARPAAGADRVGRRAVAGRAGGQAGARGGRRHADARVRRDRHRHRRPERGPGRAQPVGAGPRPPGAVRDPPAPDRRLRRRPLPDREARARRPDRHRRRRASIATSARTSWPR